MHIKVQEEEDDGGGNKQNRSTEVGLFPFCALYPVLQFLVYMCSTSQQKSMYFEPNVNIGLRGSSGQRRQKYRDGALIHYIRWFVTLYGVSVVKSVSLVKGHSISFAPMTGKVSGIYFGVCVFFPPSLSVTKKKQKKTAATLYFSTRTSQVLADFRLLPY